ncbi:MAG: hypothetical protein M1511_06305, partial [Deltaproteobacteria bacterium]|nr:hypothetical protein [Deltaproteobacteria bacterium]
PEGEKLGPDFYAELLASSAEPELAPATNPAQSQETNKEEKPEGLFKIAIKVLDVVQAFVTALGPLPKSFFLLLLLILPLSDNSIGGRWIGYILLTCSTLVLAIATTLIVTMWKYGVDQTLRVINFFRSRSKTCDGSFVEDQVFHENIKSTL